MSRVRAAWLIVCAVALTGGVAVQAQEPASSLRVGSKGTAVREVQARLTELGYPLAVDGVYGAKTAAAVRAFQRDRRIQVDGIVGPQTRGQLTAGPASLTTALGGRGSSRTKRAQAPETLLAGHRRAGLPDRSDPRAWARSARVSGRRTLVVAFEGLSSFSSAYAQQLYRYQDRLRAGESARPPRAPKFGSYVGKYLLAPSLSRHRGGPDVLVLSEASERARTSAALPVVLAWHQELGSALNLVVVGHSFGGHSALRLARKLEAQEVPVDHLLTVDPRTLPGLYDQFVTPGNVAEHANYFQRSAWFPGYPIEGARNQQLRRVLHSRMPGQASVRGSLEGMLPP